MLAFSRRIKYSSECAVSTVLAGEDDDASSLDGVVAKLGVELGEDVSRPSRVVGGPGVEDPAAVVVFLRRTKVAENLLLQDVDDSVRCCRRGRGCHGSVVDDDNRRLVEDDVVGQKEALLLFTLSHVGLGRLIALVLATFLGPVAFLAAVGAHIAAVRLALAFSPCLAAIIVLATMTSPGAGSGPILGLHAGHPRLLREEHRSPWLGLASCVARRRAGVDDFLDLESRDRAMSPLRSLPARASQGRHGSSS
jgi:hypothetical protein